MQQPQLIEFKRPCNLWIASECKKSIVKYVMIKDFCSKIDMVRLYRMKLLKRCRVLLAIPKQTWCRNSMNCFTSAFNAHLSNAVIKFLLNALDLSLVDWTTAQATIRSVSKCKTMATIIIRRHTVLKKIHLQSAWNDSRLSYFPDKVK